VNEAVTLPVPTVALRLVLAFVLGGVIDLAGERREWLMEIASRENEVASVRIMP